MTTIKSIIEKAAKVSSSTEIIIEAAALAGFGIHYTSPYKMMFTKDDSRVFVKTTDLINWKIMWFEDRGITLHATISAERIVELF